MEINPSAHKPIPGPQFPISPPVDRDTIATARKGRIEIADRGGLEEAALVWESVERESGALEGRGRVLVRASGTEPLVRVMVEAPTAEECREVCARLISVITQELT